MTQRLPKCNAQTKIALARLYLGHRTGADGEEAGYDAHPSFLLPQMATDGPLMSCREAIRHCIAVRDALAPCRCPAAELIGRIA